MQFLKDLFSSLKKNAAMLPGQDQFEPNSKFSLAIDEVKGISAQAEAVVTQAEKAVEDARKTALTEGKAAAMAEIAETHIPKTQHTELVTAAAEEAAKKGREAAAADFEAKIAAQAERAKLSDILGADAAGKVPDEALVPATAEATRARLVENAKKLSELGFTPAAKPALFAAAAEALSDEKHASFTLFVEELKSAQAAGGKAAKGANAEESGKKINALMDQKRTGEPDGEPERVKMF
jgi:hypothetical protein